MWFIPASTYKTFLKYYAQVHRFQGEHYQQMMALLALIHQQGASQSTWLSGDFRERLKRTLAQTHAVNDFYQSSVEQALQSLPFLNLRRISVWGCYLVLHEQENMQAFLKDQYSKMRLLLSQLSAHYGYGTDWRVLGAHVVARLKRSLRDLEKTHQVQGQTLRLFHQFLLEAVGEPKASFCGKYFRFKKSDMDRVHGAQQFSRLIAHCNRPFDVSECGREEN